MSGIEPHVEVSAKQYAQFSQELKKFSPELRKAMRKRINKAARVIVTAQRKAILGTNSKGEKGAAHASRAAYSLRRAKESVSVLQASGKIDKAVRNSGLRQSVARSLRVVNKDTGFNYGVRITSESGRMPAGQEKLPKLMNRGTWRHPFYGGKKRYGQTVTPPDWFDKPIKDNIDDVYREVAAAVAEARQHM